jgi:predicted transposase/invertase (TIGR01784 family)
MFDNLSKFLAQHYSADFATWLMGEPIDFTELQPTELSLEPIRADSVILLKSKNVIFHGEFQTDPEEDIGFRLADYALRIYRKYPNHRFFQVVIYLRKTQSPRVHETMFRGYNLTNEFHVVRLWEEPTEFFLERPGLLPYAALTRTDNPEAVLREVASRIDAMSDRREQSNLFAISAVMAGLSLDKRLVSRILMRSILQESSVFQEWQDQWLTEGKTTGRSEGRSEEQRSIALNMLNDGFTVEQISRLTGLSVEQVRQLQGA